MKVFLDTNVILDFYDSNRGHYMPIAVVFDLAVKGKIQLVVCAQSFITAFYILRKVYDKDALYKSMKSLFKLCQVSAVDSLIIEKALSREGFDFEGMSVRLSNRFVKRTCPFIIKCWYD